MEYWRTYTKEQAGQVLSGLNLLLERKRLDSDEEEDAKRVIRKLSYPSFWQEDKAMVQLSPSQHELVGQVEAALWR